MIIRRYHTTTVDGADSNYSVVMRVLPNSNQIKAARALLDLEQKQLAKLAKVDPTTLTRLEGAGANLAPGYASTIDRVVRALEAKGVEFIPFGVRLTKRPR